MTSNHTKNGPTPGTAIYEVQSNDTIEKIALRYNISPSELVKMNRLLSRLIYPGQKMIVPANDDFNPTSVESPSEITLHNNDTNDIQPINNEPCPEDRVMNQDVPYAKSNGIADLSHSHLTQKSPKSIVLMPETSAGSLEENDPTIQNFVKCPALYLYSRPTSTPPQQEHSSVLGGILLVTPNVIMFDSCPQTRTGKCHSFTLDIDVVLRVDLYRDITLQYILNPGAERNLLNIDQIRTIIPAGDPFAKTSCVTPPPSPPSLPHDHVIDHVDDHSKSWEIGLASEIGRFPSLSASSRDGKKRSQTIASESPRTSSPTGSKSLSSIFSSSNESPSPGGNESKHAFVRLITDTNRGGCKPVVNAGADGCVNSSRTDDADDFWFKVELDSAQKLFLFLDQCFKAKKRKAQEISKEEIRIEPLSNSHNDELPPMIGVSEILDQPHILELSSHLPPRAIGYYWILAYSTSLHGFSLSTFYRKMKLCDVDSPVLLIIRDKASQIFGALTSCPLIANDHFYGTGETFLYTFHPSFKIYKWTGENSFFMKGDFESIVVGAGNGLYGIWLDADFYHGRTHKCATFDNEPLTVDEDFVVDSLEAWYFGDPPAPTKATIK